MKIKIDYLPNIDKNSSRGEWFVARKVVIGHDASPIHEYLHHDGVWRDSTYTNAYDDNGETPSGFFYTEEEARAALARSQNFDYTP